MKEAVWRNRLPHWDIERTDSQSTTAALKSPWMTAPSLDARDLKFAPSEPNSITDVDDAYRAGCTAGREQVLSESASSLLHLQKQFDQTMEFARKSWSEAEGDRLAERIQKEVENLAIALAEDLSAVLDSWLLRALDNATRDHIVKYVTAISGECKDAIIVVGGREDLAEAIVENLIAKGFRAIAKPSQSIDIQINLPETRLQSNITKIASEIIP